MEGWKNTTEGSPVRGKMVEFFLKYFYVSIFPLFNISTTPKE
jgi:hypothetical protein